MKKIVFIMAMLCLVTMFGLVFKAQAAQDLFPSCDTTTTESSVCQKKDNPETHDNNSFYGKDGIITKIVKLYSVVTGVAAVVVIMIGGFKFVTASGDANNIKSAKNTLFFAFVGLVIAALGGAIVQFVLIKL